MKDLKKRLLNYEAVEDFLSDLREKFGEGDKEVNWRKSKREEERLRGQQNNRAQVPRLNN